MAHQIVIAGQPLEIAWTQEVAKRYQFRASKLGVDPLTLMRKPQQRLYALTCLLWILLPPDAHAIYATPEDMHTAILDDEHQAISAALVAIIGEMFPEAEKKSTGRKSHSLKSN